MFWTFEIKHIKSVHGVINVNKCESCSKSYGQKGTLKNHVETVHENIKMFRCDLCGNKFGERADYESAYKNSFGKTRPLNLILVTKHLASREVLKDIM